MRINTTLKNLLVLGILSVIIYSVISGIRNGNVWGIAMALCSMVALFGCMHLSGKLTQLKEEEEEQY